MNYKQVTALKGGERIKVWQDGEYRKATFKQHIQGADAAAWIAFDERQIVPGSVITTKVFTGLQFTEEHWSEYQDKLPPKFLMLTDEELNAEIIEKMELMG